MRMVRVSPMSRRRTPACRPEGGETVAQSSSQVADLQVNRIGAGLGLA